MGVVYFDTETSSLVPGQIGQLACIIQDDAGHLTGKNYYFEIDSIDDGAAAVTHRGIDFYREESHGTRFADKSDEIAEIFKGKTAVAHNIDFDEKFLSMEFWRVGRMFSLEKKFDTMKYFKPIVKATRPGSRSIKNPKLEEVINYYNVDIDAVLELSNSIFGRNDAQGYHDACVDTTAMMVVTMLAQEDNSGADKHDWRDRFVVQ